MGNANLHFNEGLNVTAVAPARKPERPPMQQQQSARRSLAHRDPMAVDPTMMMNIAPRSLPHREPMQVQMAMPSLPMREPMSVSMLPPQPSAACLPHREPMAIPSQMAMPSLNMRDPMSVSMLPQQQAVASLPHRDPMAFPVQMAMPGLHMRDPMSVSLVPQPQPMPRPPWEVAELTEAVVVDDEPMDLVQQPAGDSEYFHERMQFYSDQQALLEGLSEESTQRVDLVPEFTSERREDYFVRQEELLNQLQTIAGAIMPAAVNTDHLQSARAKRRRAAANSGEEDERSVRVFLSSTFKDMAAERELLVRRIMPQLRALGAARGVDVSEVDLRWGISEEQSMSGSTISICLQEVDRCRPYFVCMLGERYGWSQQGSQRDELLAKTFTHAEPLFPWIKRYTDRSVTELEVRHGVLNGGNPAPDPSHCLFLLRDPEYATGKGPDFESETPSAAARLAELKQQIQRCSGSVATVRNYTSPEEAAAQVLDHLSAAIARDFPEALAPTLLEQERAVHAAFARSRTRVHVGEEHLIHKMLSHCAAQDSAEHPAILAVFAPQGQGKSALLAAFARRIRESRSGDTALVEHYCSAAHTTLPRLLRRLAEEIVDAFDLPADALPEAGSTMRLMEELPKLLHEASARGGLTIVLDGLDGLDPSDGAHDLLWLPQRLPARVQLVLSAATGTRPHTVLSAFGGPLRSIEVEPLDDSSRRKIAETIMARHGKSLSAAQISKLVSAPQSGNPFWLRAALEELRVFGSFEALNSRIESIVACEDPPKLIALILSRIETEEAPNAVATLLGCLCVARRGLREEEASAVLQLPGMAWSSLRLALSDFLDSRAGLLTFAHDFVRQAATQRYLKTGAARFRDLLIGYFSTQKTAERACEELPDLLLGANRTGDLASFISTPKVFLTLCAPRYRFDLIRFVRHCNSAGSPADQRAATAIAAGSALADMLVAGKFFSEVAAYQAAELVYKAALKRAETEDSKVQMAAVRDALGYLYRLQARFEEATPHYVAALSEREKAFGKESAEVAATSCSLAILYRKRGLYDLAEPLYLRSCELRERILGHWNPETAVSHNGLGCLYQDQGKDALSEKHFRMALEIRERCFGVDDPQCAMTCNNLGTLLMTQARLDEAEQLCSRALRIYRSVYGDVHPDTANALSYLASILVEKGKYADARPLYEQAIAIRVQLLTELHPEVADSVTDLGVLCARERKYDEALANYQRALRIRTTVLGPEHPDTAQAMNNVAAILMDRGEHDLAEQMYTQALQITERKFGPNHVSVVQSLLKLANLFQREGRPFEEIIALYERSLGILTDCYGAAHPDIALTLNDMAVLSFREGRMDEAETLYKRMLSVLQQLFAGKDHPEVARAFENIALFYRAIGKEADALDFERKGREMWSRI